MRSLKQFTLALLLCCCFACSWGTNGLVSAGERPSPIISAPTLEDILSAPRQIDSDTDYVLVRLSEDSACGSVSWRKTAEFGPIFGRASFSFPQARIWPPCCPIPDRILPAICRLCDSLEIFSVEMQITLSDPVYLAKQNLPLIRVPFRAPSKGIVIATASVDVNKAPGSADLSRIEIGISEKREIPANLNGKKWELPSNKTKSKNSRCISMQKQFPVEDSVTVISLYGRNHSGDSDVYIQGRTLFLTFIPDFDSNQRKSGDARQNDQKNK